jgi:putative FmdB family regulatory protein
MPIYEYRCLACGVRFEVLHLEKVTGEGTECPHCHAPHSRRVMSRFATKGSKSMANDPLLKDLPEDLRNELPEELREGIPDEMREEVEAAGGLEALAEGAGEEGMGGGPYGGMGMDD